MEKSVMAILIGGAVAVTVGSVAVAVNAVKKFEDVMNDRKVIHIPNDKRRETVKKLVEYAEQDKKVDAILENVRHGVKAVKVQGSEEDLVFKFHTHIENRADKTKTNGTDILVGDPISKEQKQRELREKQKELNDQAKMQIIADAVKEGFRKDKSDSEAI